MRIFAGRLTRARRLLGIAWLGLGLFAYGVAIFSYNGCIEGYADWTSCDVAGSSGFLGVVLMAGTAIWTICIGLWRLFHR